MRIALIAPPFICVPPRRYGGTELFVAHLAKGLDQLGIEVVVYTNGESTIGVEKRWVYEAGRWPIDGDVYDSLMDVNHTAWSVADATATCDIIHLNNAPGLAYSRFIQVPFVYTIHHPRNEGLSQYYSFYPEVDYVTISDFQRLREPLQKLRTIHHGVDLSLYKVYEGKREFLTFLGRICPIKGTDVAIEVAKRTGIPLKIAGEIQPIFREYWENKIKPHVDGVHVEYVGEVDLAAKNELLGKSLAMLFPIKWDEPFGLVMVEAMACGTPVLALPGGSVTEIIQDGVSGFVCRDADEMGQKASNLDEFTPTEVRSYAEKFFSVDRMVDQYASLYRKILGAQAPQSIFGDEQRAIA